MLAPHPSHVDYEGVNWALAKEKGLAEEIRKQLLVVANRQNFCPPYDNPVVVMGKAEGKGVWYEAIWHSRHAGQQVVGFPARPVLGSSIGL